MSELRTDSREWVHRIMGSLDRMLVGIENLAVGNRPVPVSYTHLDVYKRQDHHPVSSLRGR